MAVDPPTAADLDHMARLYGLALSAADIDDFLTLQEPLLRSYARIDVLHESTERETSAPPAATRDGGRPPSPEENPWGAWCWKADVRGAAGGPLSGRTMAVKDNISVGGLPMRAGTSLLEGFVPEADATVVERALAAGATIAGKAACESLCFSAGSHTSSTGPVRNPHDPTRSTGGSSSGNGALLASGEVDMAIGCDAAGSIRIPSAWCGVYGLKPTYGTVPYTGIMPLELTLDHAGPMGRTVADVAALMEALTSPRSTDGHPERREGRAGDTDALSQSPPGLRVGVLTDGFGWRASEADVDEAVREAAFAFAGLGARVQEVSVPWHREGLHIFNGICLEGASALLGDGRGVVTNVKRRFDHPLLDAYARGFGTHSDALPDTLIRSLLLGGHMRRAYHGRYYARAQNLALHLAAAYDRALRDVDVLAMPTVPMKATRLPSAGLDRAEAVARAYETIHNTCAFNVTGHPAMSIPCAVSEGLPVGLMLVGRRHEDALVLRAAAAFEREVFAAPAAVSGPHRVGPVPATQS